MFDHIFDSVNESMKEDNRKKISVVNEDKLPEIQQWIKDTWGSATQKQMFQKSTYPGEEDDIKFWVLNDGTLIFVRKAHMEVLVGWSQKQKGRFAKFYLFNELLGSGAIRVLVQPDTNTLLLQYEEDRNLTTEQIRTLQGLSKLHNIDFVSAENGNEVVIVSTNISSPSELSNILRGEVKQKSLAAQFHESVNESELPEMQKRYLKIYMKDEGEYLKPDDIVGGFWILSNGKIIDASRHRDVMDKLKIDWDAWLSSGVLRGMAWKQNSINLEKYEGTSPTAEQIKTVSTILHHFNEADFYFDVSRDLSTQHRYVKVKRNDFSDRVFYAKVRKALNESIQEATLSQLKRKQQSVTKLFPDFYSNPDKVPGIARRGGIKMKDMDKDKWEFQIHSGSEDGLWYDAVIKWKNVGPDLERAVMDRRNWTKKKDRVDLNKVSTLLMKKLDVELSCSCPAMLYWGKDYILSQDKYRAKYGEPRSPDIRNPKQYGAYCKHLTNLQRVLPFYKGTMSQWLKQYYGDVIKKAEDKARKVKSRFAAAGSDVIKKAEDKARKVKSRFAAAGKKLGKRRVESIQESEELPELQMWMKKKFGVASDKDMEIKSTFPGEEQIKFWLLNDGTFIHVSYAHYDHLPRNISYWKAYKTGAIRGYITEDPVSNDMLNLSFFGMPNLDQIRTLESLAKKHDIDYVWIDKDQTGSGYKVQSYRELGNILRGKVQQKSLAAQFHESKDDKLGWSGFVKSDGVVIENDPREEHAEIINKNSNLRGAAEYRIYPVMVGYGDFSFIVVRVYNELTKPQSDAIDKLMSIWPQPLKFMNIERLSHPMMDGLIEPIDDDWPEQLRRKLALDRKVQSLAAQFHENVNEDKLPEVQQQLKKYWTKHDGLLDEIETHTIILNDGTLLGGESLYHEDILWPVRKKGEAPADLERRVVESGAIPIFDSFSPSELIIDCSGKLTASQWKQLATFFKSGFEYDRIIIEADKTGNFYQIDPSEISRAGAIQLIKRILSGNGPKSGPFFVDVGASIPVDEVRVNEEGNEWYAWWITKDGLFTVGKDLSGGDHYGTLEIIDDPEIFGVSKADIQDIWSEEDEWIEDEEGWIDLVNKVMSKNIRIGLHSGELYMDFPDESNIWLRKVQQYEDQIKKAGEAKNVTIEITASKGAVSPVYYGPIPAEEFWAANKLSDLRTYKR